MRIFLFFILLPILILISCSKIEPAEDAFFLRAKKINVAPTTQQGSGSHRITDLWLYVNGQFQGSYPVGKMMPIISKGKSVKLNIFAGIRNNGISDTRIFSQIYSLLEFDTLVESGKTIERDFTFGYSEYAVFPFNEDFEGGPTGYGMERSPISGVNYRIASADDSFEGKSIELALSGDTLVAQIESTNAYALPSGSSNVYLELDYKCNHEFLVGLIGETGAEKNALVIKANENWNKIYVQLSNAVSSEPISNKYKVFFRLIKRDIDNPKIFLDNIKLVHLS